MEATRRTTWCFSASLLAAALLALAFALPADAAKSGPARSLQTAKGIGTLEPTALKRWPDSFGGMWLERGKLFVAFTDQGARRTNRLGRTFSRPGALRAVKVDDSLNSLRTLQATVIAERELSPRPGLLLPVRVPYDIDVDVKRNTVVVIVEQPTAALTSAFAARYGPDVIVEQGVLAAPHVCNSREDCPPFLRSGLKLTGSTNCSAAFGVLFPDPKGTEKIDGILSAGHCGNPDSNIGEDMKHNGVTYGEVVSQQQSGKVDAELHSVGNNFFSFFPLIYRSNAVQAAHVGKIGTYAGTLIGQTVCKAGITTGEGCGPVLSKTYAPSYIPNSSDFFKVDYCSQSGDSGAGVYSHYTKPKPGSKTKKLDRYEALGVHSGGAKDIACASEQHYGLFGHIEFVKGALGVTVLRNPN